MDTLAPAQNSEPPYVGWKREAGTKPKEELIVGVREDDVLVRDESFVKYDRLLNKAEEEGRIDGPHKCLTCGMRYLTKEEAEDCCKINS
jgi:hypothetical protein